MVNMSIKAGENNEVCGKLYKKEKAVTNAEKL